MNENLKKLAQKRQKYTKEKPYQPDKEFEKKQQQMKDGKNPSGNVNKEEVEQLKSSIMADEAVSGSIYYLFGAVYTWFKLNDLEPPNPNQVVEEFKKLREVKKEDQREFLENPQKPIHQFLKWYFLDSRE